MEKIWREVTKPVCFSEMDNRMRNKFNDHETRRWIFFDLATIHSAAVHAVFDIAMLRA
jgi:hypothetical protein